MGKTPAAILVARFIAIYFLILGACAGFILAGTLWVAAALWLSGCGEFVEENCRVVEKCYPREGLPPICSTMEVCD